MLSAGHGREIAAERGVRDPVRGSELPEALAGRPAANQLGVGVQAAQAAVALLRRCRRRLLGPQKLHGLLELLGDLRPGEVAAERGVRSPVSGSELPERLASRPAASQLGIGLQAAKSAVALH